MMKAAKYPDGSVEAGLICLCAIAKPNQRFTQDQIARACGITRGGVFMIEQRALRKIRERFRRKFGLSYGEICDSAKGDFINS